MIFAQGATGWWWGGRFWMRWEGHIDPPSFFEFWK